MMPVPGHDTEKAKMENQYVYKMRDVRTDRFSIKF